MTVGHAATTLRSNDFGRHAMPSVRHASLFESKEVSHKRTTMGRLVSHNGSAGAINDCSDAV